MAPNVRYPFKLFTSPPEERVWEYTLPGTRDIVIDRANSKSYIQLLPDAEREQVRQDVGAIVDKGEGLVWRNEEYVQLSVQNYSDNIQQEVMEIRALVH